MKIQKNTETPSFRNVYISFALLALIAALVSTVVASNDPYTPRLTPGSPVGSYSLGGFDNVNIFSGNLNTTVPLMTIGGRGNIKVPVIANFDTLWHVNVEQPFPNDPGYYTYFPIITGATALLGLSNNIGGGLIRNYSYESFQSGYCPPGGGGIPAGTIVTISFRAPDGTQHNLVDKAYYGAPLTHDPCTLANTANRGREFVSMDGEAITFIADSDQYDDRPPYPDTPPSHMHYSDDPSFDNIPGYLYLPDGSTYRFDNGNLQWITDKDGNKTTFNYNSNNRVSSIIDSEGREIDFEYGITDSSPYGVCDRITFKGTGAATRYIRLSHTSLSNSLRTTQTGDSSTVKDYTDLFSNSTTTGSFNPDVVSAIWLPNGQSYKLRYSVYRQLARLELPTGGAFEYDYAASTISGSPEEAFRVTKKRVYDENNVLQGTTEFAMPQTDYVTTQADVSQKDPSGHLLSKTSHYFDGFPDDQYGASVWSRAYSPWTTGREFKTEMWDAAGTSVLVRVEKTWEQPSTVSWWQSNMGPSTASPSNNPRVSEEKTTLVDADLVSKRTFSYDDTQPFNNVKEVAEYDWGTGAPASFLRTTHTDYVTASNYISYSGAHLRRLPSTTWVSSDSAGTNKAAYTQYEYDNYASDSSHHPIVDRTSVVGFDSTNYSTSNGVRGNVTAVTRYENAGNLTGAVASYTQYDILGNVVASIDANGHTTTIDYTDDFGSADGEARTNSAPAQLSGQNSFAFPTSTTDPLGWTDHSQYDYYTGAEVDSEDVNGVVNSMFFDDPLDRQTKVIEANNFPDFKNQTRAIYHDTDHFEEVRSDLYQFQDELSKSENYYDGLGRTTESRSYESNGGYVSVQTQYDALGRVKQTTNPYRPLAGDQTQWKITRYDSLNRITENESPTGAIMKTAYSGNETTVTDPALRSRRSRVDALGRLLKIYEDPVLADDQNPQSRLNYETTYTYDVMGNLTSSVQGSQTRTFTYDSLSRLLAATNPESGTVTYAYDGNNNLLTKTDARGISVTHTYDAINRPLTKNYSDGVTPNATYTYEDQNIPNSRGKLTRLETTTSINRYTSFDVLGRTLASEQITAGQIYDFGYTYDLSGDLKTETYPSSRIVNYDYNNDGDLNRVYGRPNQNAIDRTYASDFVYTPHGKVKSLRLGNGKFESTLFNSNLQPFQIALGSAVDGTGLWKLSYDYGSTDNNGNVKSQTVTVPTIGSVSGFAAVQTYSYDALNRLQAADEKPQFFTQADCNNDPSKCWKQTFAYDRYGNRQFDLSQTTLPNLAGTSAKVINPTSNIQNNKFTLDQDNDGLNDYEYDSAGNLTRDAEGRTFSYNGENKQIAVRDSGSSLTTQYDYDGDGNRVKKTIPATGEQLIYVYDADGDLAAEYNINATPPQNPSTNYLTADALGSPRVITDSYGSVTARRDFMPFGEEIQPGVGNRSLAQKYTSDNIDEKFTGKKRDAETGFDYFEARYYASKWGRFTTSDEFVGGPEELIDFDGMLGNNPTFYADISIPQSLNKFQYSYNNPLKYSDPSGHCPPCAALPWAVPVIDGIVDWLVVAGTGAAVGGGAGLAVDGAIRGRRLPNYGEEPNAVNRFEQALEKDALDRADQRNRSNTSPPPQNRSQEGGSAGSRSPNNSNSPNPNGRKGGEKHQQKVREVVKDVRSRGLRAETEKRIDTPGGNKSRRFADVVGVDKKTGKIREIHQVGRQNKNKTPVSRERQASSDIENATKKKVKFHPYNQ